MTSFTQDIVEVGWVKYNLDAGKIKIFDVAYTMSDKPDPAKFAADLKGKWDALLALKQPEYDQEHISGAPLWNLDACQYPSETVRFELYPPHEFFMFMRKMGITDEDHVVFYSRGRLNGMFFAARAWWLLKVYGHTKVSVMHGGLEGWKKAGYPVDNKPVLIKESEWFAKPMNIKIWIALDEMMEKKASGKSWLDDPSQINLYDVRDREQFEGSAPKIYPTTACGAHIPGAKNFPLSSFIGPNGLKTKEEVEKVLTNIGFVSGKPTVVLCNFGIGASCLVLFLARNGKQVRLYNGGYAELGLAAPQYISATGPQ